MAKRVVLLDDLDQTVIDEKLGGGTVEFSFDGRHYQIDLGVKNKDNFIQAIKPWIDAAEEVEAPRRRSASTSSGRTRKSSGSGRSKEDLQAIRDWATKNGHEVSPRGRIASPILEAYDQAHASTRA